LIDITEKDGSVSFNVCVVPRSSKSEVVGEHYRSLKVKITAPPVDGAANAELVKVLAKHFGVPRANIHIVSGPTSKNKRIKIENLSQSAVESFLT
jgi:uncharacterized protein (TIGR00251 family)